MMRRVLGSLALGAVTLAVAQPYAQQAPRFRFERPVVADAQGPHLLRVDVPLLSGAARFDQLQPMTSRDGRWWRAHGGLGDLRLYDASGREVPYLLVYPGARTQEWMRASVLATATREKTSGFEADLGGVEVVDMILVEGLPSPFLKRLVLEGSGDRERWTLLAGEGTLFDLPEERLRQLALPFRAGPYRFLRVTWDDTNSGRVPLPRAVLARRAPSGAAAPPPLTADASVEQRPSEPGRSRYRVRLPAAGLPIVALNLDVAGGHVLRMATVSESTLRGAQAVPTEIGRATLTRVVRDGLTAADLRIPVKPPAEARVDLAVEDGNNPPLAMNRVILEFAELPRIYFEAPGGPLTARYGDPNVRTPRYDLEAARDGIRVGGVPEARWGDARETTASEATATALPMPDTGATLDTASFRHRRSLPAGPQGLVALALDAAVLAESDGPARGFQDVRVVDESGRQVPYLLERLEEPLSLELAVQPFEGKAPELKRGPGRSVYAAQLPYESLPDTKLVLETSGRVFSRLVETGLERPADRGHRDPWFEVLSTTTWRHADQDVPAPALTLPLNHRAGRAVVVVHEGDNAPLPITGARLLLPLYRLRFYHPGRPLQLLYGAEVLAPPRYDLALLAPQVMGAEAREIGAEGPVQTTARPVTSLVSPRVFWAGLVVAVLVLGALIVRLLKAPAQ